MIQRYLKLLSDLPWQIAEMTASLDQDFLARPPHANDWSINEILAHLRACADVWTFSMIAMLVEDNPSLPRLHPRDWHKVVRYGQIEFKSSLEAYLQQRRELLKILISLPTVDWDKSAVIAGRTHTIYTQARRMTKHELGHKDQIFEIITKINSENQTTIFLVEQNANLALKVAHRGYVMENGRITLADTAANLFSNEAVRKAYLGM